MKRIYAVAAAGAITLASGSVAVRSAATAPVDLVARANNQELTVERLASLMATSSIPIQKDVAAAVADFWVNYHLVGYAGAHGDTLADSTSTNWWIRDTASIDRVMWQQLLDARGRLFFDKVTRTIAMPDTSNLDEKYVDSPFLAAQHILFMLPEGGAGMSQAKQDSVLTKAQDVRRRVTAENFSALARQFSEDGGSKDNGGTYAMFGPGTGLEMVPEFNEAVRKAKPGEIVPGLVRTTYGYHIIRRHTLDEVRSVFIDQLAQANVGTEGQKYVEKLVEEWKLRVEPDAVAPARAVARNPVEERTNQKVLATSLLGDFTAARLAEWIEVLPPGLRMREMISQGPDSLVVRALSRIVSQEIIQAQAIKEGVELGPEERRQIRADFAGMVIYAMTGLKVDPKALMDSAATQAARERLAAARVERAIGRVFESNGKDVVDVAPQLATALRKRYPSRINSASIAVAVERGLAIRAALDSTRAGAGKKN
jgi:hypothetical protein